jgi:hypothetical protein
MSAGYDSNGRLIVPVSNFKNEASISRQRFLVTEVYCANGHNLIDAENPINSYPGIRLKFRRAGNEGLFVISALEGEFDKIILSGKLETGLRFDLHCPVCNVRFPVLTTCHCQEQGQLVVLGLTPDLDFNNSIAFCNVAGCDNGIFIKSGIVLRHARLTY